jgi:Fungal N-terminal domain of STAND proteins
MTDPFSITVGVVGLLSTLAGVSVQLNDMRKEFMEAENEIDSLLRELTDLTNVLSKLQAAQGGLSLPHTLSRDLAGLLRNCSDSATEAEIPLRKSSARRFRAAHWSFSGKKECLQLCRGLEAYKATLNIALNVYSA